MTVFERLFVAATLEEAALTTLQKWLPTYIREVERQSGLTPGNLKPPQLYTNRNSFDVLPGEKWPLCVAISPGVGAITKKGDGQYVADWRLGVGIAFPAQTEQIANLSVKMYGAAIRGIMVQKSSLGGVVENVRWSDETYDDLPLSMQNMVYKSVTEMFAVEVQDVVTAVKGPDEPDQDYYVWGEVEEVFIEIVKEPIDAVL